MQLAWTTDIHLNFLPIIQINTWLDTIHTIEKPDVLLITGDIGEANSVCEHLTRIVQCLDIPVYFVLGNHDYYRGSVDGVRRAVKKLCAEYSQLRWLPDCDVVKLAEDTALVGHGCWSDGGYGDFQSSSVVLNDYLLIADLSACCMQPQELLTAIQALGKEGGDYLRGVLAKAAKQYKQVYVAVHSPPFQETAWHEGRTPTNDDPHLPHFTCKAAGDALLDSAKQFPDTQFTVLCGHTHGEGERLIKPNLRVQTGGAEYGNPQIKRVFEI